MYRWPISTIYYLTSCVCIPSFFMPPYRLYPTDPGDERRTWDFKCDTLNELNEWSQAFSESIALANTLIESKQGSTQRQKFINIK